MAFTKSGKQRALEIKAARQVRARRRIRQALEPVARPRPAGAVAVSPSLLAPNNSYDSPEFLLRGYYADIHFRCLDCGAECVWTADRQRWWYEIARGDVFSTAIRCKACRAVERARKATARRIQQQGMQQKSA